MTFYQIPPCSVLLTLQDSNEYDTLGDDIQINNQPLYALILRLIRKSLPTEVSIHVAAESRIYSQIKNDYLDKSIDHLYLRKGTQLTECFESAINTVDHEHLIWINGRQIQSDYVKILTSALNAFSLGSAMVMSITSEPLVVFDDQNQITSLKHSNNNQVTEDASESFFSRQKLANTLYFNKSFIGIQRDSLRLLSHYDRSAIQLIETAKPLFVEDLRQIFKDRMLIGMMADLLSI
jgi:DNA polymerase III psi subunit